MLPLFRMGIVMLVALLFTGCIVSVDPRVLDDSGNVPVDNPPVITPPIVNPPIVSPPVTPPVTSPTTITLSKTEVAKHSTKKDCWTVYSQNVYNISSYTSHPGGNVYVPYCGRDMTNAYNAQGHSGRADQILERFFLGVVGETIPASKVTV